MKRNNQSLSVGNIYASDMFGHLRDTVKPTVENSRNAHGKPTVNPPESDGKPTVISRSNRATFTDCIPENRTKAVHPFITTEAFSVTMENYRIYINKFNKRIKELNREIDIYNGKVASKLSEVQLAYSALFYKKNLGKPAKDYNIAADEFNSNYGQVIKKLKFPTVKYATELVFQQILFAYSLQLSKQTIAFIRLGVVTEKELTGADLNAHTITRMKRNGDQALRVCRQTLRNHRARLEEAGVLLDYDFRGPNRGVRHNINEQILTVFDSKTQKMTGAENQCFIGESSKDFKECNNDITRTLINKSINKRKTVPDFSDKERSSGAVPFNSLLQEHLGASKQNLNTPAAENVKVSTFSKSKMTVPAATGSLSQKLLATIEHPQALAENLSAGNHNTYQPIDIRYLHREAMYGTLTREEFNELIINDFFKTAAKYYRNHTVYVGSWKKAINSWLQNTFYINNGNGKNLCNKQLMADKLAEFRYRLKTSEGFYQRTGIKRLFPSDYFDFSRKNKEEIGFEYTKTHYQKHLKYQQTAPQQLKKVAKNAELRKTRINHSKKYDAVIKKYFNNRIGWNELYSYVQENLPANYLDQLTAVLLKTNQTYY